MRKLSELDIKEDKEMPLVGKSIRIEEVLGKEIEVHSYRLRPSNKKEGEDCLHLQIAFEGEKRVIFSSGRYLIRKLTNISEELFPFSATITQEGRAYFIN